MDRIRQVARIWWKAILVNDRSSHCRNQNDQSYWRRKKTLKKQASTSPMTNRKFYWKRKIEKWLLQRHQSWVLHPAPLSYQIVMALVVNRWRQNSSYRRPPHRKTQRSNMPATTQLPSIRMCQRWKNQLQLYRIISKLWVKDSSI